MINIARSLHEKYNWNVIPMFYFSRNKDTGIKVAKRLDNWNKYKSEPYNYSDWKEEYKAICIITGQISNLTVLDIDSQEALETLLSLTGKELKDLSEYIVKTYKGYQLFYTYEPGVKTRIGIKDHIDFLNGGITYATPSNDGYTIVKDSIPTAMPNYLKDLILDKENEAESAEMLEIERKIKENSNLPYKYPMQPIAKELLEATRVGQKLKAKLEKIFCTKNYSDYELKDFSKPGQIHTSMIYVAGIVAANPTISKTLYIDFMKTWASKVAKLDINDMHEQNLIENRIKAGMNFFRYNEGWKSKTESLSNLNIIAEVSDRKVWRDLENEKYVIYEPKKKRLLRLSRISFKEEMTAEHNEHNPDEPLTVNDIDVTKLKPIYDTFDPTVDDEFFTNEYGEKMYNNFKRSPMLSYFQTCEPSLKMPEFINNLIHHLYPIKTERDMFLHTLAYHMTYLQVSPTAYILTGKSGTGKNMLMQGILAEIYQDMHTSISAETLTGKFRNLLKNKLLVFIDEVSEKAHKATDRGSIHNVIKQIVANPMISVEAKGKDETNYPNHALYVMASNKDEPFKLEEGFDRRINITKTNDDNLRTLEWFPKHLSTSEIDELVISEVPQFVEYLASIDLNNVLYSKTIENKQRKNLISNSVSLVDQYVEAILIQDADALFELDHEFGEWFEKRFIKDNISYSTLKDLKERLGDIGTRVIKLLKLQLNCKLISGHRSIVINPKGHKELDKVEAIA